MAWKEGTDAPKMCIGNAYRLVKRPKHIAKPWPSAAQLHVYVTTGVRSSSPTSSSDGRSEAEEIPVAQRMSAITRPRESLVPAALPPLPRGVYQLQVDGIADQTIFVRVTKNKPVSVSIHRPDPPKNWNASKRQKTELPNTQNDSEEQVIEQLHDNAAENDAHAEPMIECANEEEKEMEAIQEEEEEEEEEGDDDGDDDGDDGDGDDDGTPDNDEELQKKEKRRKLRYLWHLNKPPLPWTDYDTGYKYCDKFNMYFAEFSWKYDRTGPREENNDTAGYHLVVDKFYFETALFNCWQAHASATIKKSKEYDGFGTHCLELSEAIMNDIWEEWKNKKIKK